MSSSSSASEAGGNSRSGAAGTVAVALKAALIFAGVALRSAAAQSRECLVYALARRRPGPRISNNRRSRADSLEANMMKRGLLALVSAGALAVPLMVAPALVTPAAAQASLNIGLSVPGPAVPAPMFGVAPAPAYAWGYGYPHREWEHRDWERHRWHEWERHHYDHHWR
jgi:hypothetical protein